MKFSLDWLSEFIEVQDFFNDPEKLFKVLTQSGLEVASFEDQRDQFKNIVVVEIQSSEKHPQADRLSVCKVYDGSKSYSVVCGAKNYRTGDKALFAYSGAVLPRGIKIKKSRIRGVDSEGMLLSRSELGFESTDEGIWILPKETSVGESLSNYLDRNDLIFEITVPPNRSDCLSHRGLAREISCLFSIPFSEKNIPIQEKSSLKAQSSLKVEVRESKGCPRYCGRLIENVCIGESPPWLKKRLNAIGLKSINNVVDITNFVLWDRGQPLHAFDRDKIQSITVALSKKSETFFALDESCLTLTGEELTIRDGDRVLALAGVIGGMDSSITGHTKNIFIESACFAPEKIRKASRYFGLETDSSYRFTRGLDINSVKESMDLACSLIQKEAGGVVSGNYYDIYKEPPKPADLSISLSYVEERLGYRVSPSHFHDVLKKSGGRIQRENNCFYFLSPSYRTDLKIKEDLIEEFARLEGYDRIPEKPPAYIQNTKASDFQFVKSRKLISFLSGKGWNQAINYSFCDPAYHKEFLGDGVYMESLFGNIQKSRLKKEWFFVNNPISRQLSLMKPLLVPDMIKNVFNNLRRNNKFGQIFELSPVFWKAEGQYEQEAHLVLSRWGHPIDIWRDREVSNVYVIKSILESLFEFFHIKGVLWKKTDISFLHPQQSLAISLQDWPIGFLGSLHPGWTQKYKILFDVAVAELHLGFLDHLKKGALKFKPFSSLLTVEKDLCFVVPYSISVEDVKRDIKKTLSPFCERVEVFDIYEKQGERSVSFRMFFIPQGRSWTDQQLQSLLNQTVESVDKKFSIHLKSL